MPSMTAQSCPRTLPCLISTMILIKDIIKFIFQVRALRPRETEDLPESWSWKRQSQDPNSGPNPKFILLPLIPEYTWDSKGSNYKKSEFVTELKKKNNKKHRHCPIYLADRVLTTSVYLDLDTTEKKCKSHWSGEKKTAMMSTLLDSWQTVFSRTMGRKSVGRAEQEEEEESTSIWEKAAGHQGAEPQAVKPKGRQPHMRLMRYLYSFLF